MLMHYCGFFVYKEVIVMTLNIFFLTITIKSRQYSEEEIKHEQYVRQLEEEIKDRKYEFYRHF